MGQPYAVSCAYGTRHHHRRRARITTSAPSTAQRTGGLAVTAGTRELTDQVSGS